MKKKAFAKVNLYLDILGKRPDGYHELTTLMCPIGLFDIIHLSFGTREISVCCDHPDVPGGSANIAHEAAAGFMEAAEIRDKGVAIRIEKNIPVGAGLGGGTSNAATVLTALNARFGFPLSREKLCDIGATVGVDTVFFIHGKPAVATGIGDIITPVSGIPPFHLVLIYPNRVLSTRTVYKNFNLGLTKYEKIHNKSILDLDWDADLNDLLFNALEPPAFELEPQVLEAKERILDAGAEAALMSGSGSSVFGIYKNPATARKAFRRLNGEHGWQVFHTRLRV